MIGLTIDLNSFHIFYNETPKKTGKLKLVENNFLTGVKK